MRTKLISMLEELNFNKLVYANYDDDIGIHDGWLYRYDKQHRMNKDIWCQLIVVIPEEENAEEYFVIYQITKGSKKTKPFSYELLHRYCLTRTAEETIGIVNAFEIMSVFYKIGRHFDEQEKS